MGDAWWISCVDDRRLAVWGLLGSRVFVCFSWGRRCPHCPTQHQPSTSPVPPCLRQNVAFGVFGLGNRQYEHFCAMGKKVSNAMKVRG